VTSEVFIFAHFHASNGLQDAVAAAIQEVLGPTRQEPGCLYIHSRWKDEAAFDRHAQLPHTLRFVEQVQLIIDPPFEVTRTTALA
jgi:quinol monooxygenase YgiN